MAGKGRKVDQTATWAVAIVCAVIIIISLVWEKVLHRIGKVRPPPSPTSDPDK